MKTCDIKSAFEKDNIAIAFAVDSNYLPYLKYAIKSIAANLKRGNLDIIILHGGALEGAAALSDYFKDAKNISIRFIDVGQIAANKIEPYYEKKRYFTLASTYRLLLPELLPAYEKILWLDIDIAVTGDLSELFETELGEYALGAVLDYGQGDQPPLKEWSEERWKAALAWAKKYNFRPWRGYFNSGVLLMNLEALRKENNLKRLVEIMCDPLSHCPDQDALNIVYRGKVKYLDDKWNFHAYWNSKQEAAAPGIIHYVGPVKPWNSIYLELADIWYRYTDLDDEARKIIKTISDTYERKIKDLKSRLREMKHSFSNKLGRALTKPFRIFTKKKK